MEIIKLHQVCRIHAAGNDGEERIEWESIYIQVSHIESFFSAGRTVIELASGRRIEVKETPEEITSHMPCSVFKMEDPKNSVTFDSDDTDIPW